MNKNTVTKERRMTKFISLDYEEKFQFACYSKSIIEICFHYEIHFIN